MSPLRGTRLLASFQTIMLLSELSETKSLQPYIMNPIDKQENIFLLFDSIHILKCICNNWINLKNLNKTFTFPDFDDSQFNFARFFQRFREYIHKREMCNN